MHILSNLCLRRFNCFGSEHEVGYFHAYVDGVDYVFVDHPCFHSRGKDIYGGSRLDALFRCSLLSKAALEAVSTRQHIHSSAALLGGCTAPSI
jgi:hypothetical protein